MAGWFRLYAEMKSDRKLRRVSAGQRWLWVVMLMYASESPDPGWLLLSEGVPVTEEDLADDAGISLEEVQSGIKAFMAQRMLEEADGVYHLVNWDKRQFKSDNSTDRWRKWKDRQQTIGRPAGVNQPGQEQGRASGLQDKPCVQKAILSSREVNQLNRKTSQLPAPTCANVGPTSPDTDTDTDVNNADAGAPARENFVITYEQEFGRLISPAELEALGQYAGTAEGEALVCEAIRRTRAQGKGSLRYVTSILQSWRDQGIVNLAGVSRDDQEFARRKKGHSRRRSPPEAGPLPAANEAKRDLIKSLYRN